MARPAIWKDSKMSKQKADVEGILNTLASIRGRIPMLANVPAKPPVNETTSMGSFVPGDQEAMEAFEMETLAEALESFADELSESIETARQKALEKALEIYYAAEKLAKDPEHADLIPYVEQMREIYRRDFGTDIPAR